MKTVTVKYISNNPTNYTNSGGGAGGRPVCECIDIYQDVKDIKKFYNNCTLIFEESTELIVPFGSIMYIKIEEQTGAKK